MISYVVILFGIGKQHQEERRQEHPWSYSKKIRNDHVAPQVWHCNCKLWFDLCILLPQLEIYLSLSLLVVAALCSSKACHVHVRLRHEGGRWRADEFETPALDRWRIGICAARRKLPRFTVNANWLVPLPFNTRKHIKILEYDLSACCWSKEAKHSGLGAFAFRCTLFSYSETPALFWVNLVQQFVFVWYRSLDNVWKHFV